MMKIAFLTLLSLCSFGAACTEWQHQNPNFDRTGQVTIKSLAGVTSQLVNTGQQGLQSSASPTVLSVAGGGNYQWTDGLLLSDGFYYVYEEELGIYVRYSPEQFVERFTATEENVITIPFLTTKYGINFRMVTRFDCGNSAWASNNSCSITTCDVTFDEAFYVTTGADSCYVYSDGDQIASSDITSIHSTGYYFSSYSSFSVSHRLNMPANFSHIFGLSASVTGSGGQSIGSSCSNASVPPGEEYHCTGGVTNRTGAEAGFRYYFNENWRGTGNAVALYQSYGTGTNKFVAGKYAFDGQSYDIPIQGQRNVFNISANESGTVFYTTVDNTIYAFGKGSDAKVVMANTSLTVQKALIIHSYQSP